MKALVVICAPLLPFFAGAAMGQSLAPEQKSTPQFHSAGAELSVDRSSGRGKFSIKCAASDSTRDCIQAILPVLSSGQSGGGVIYATTSIKCGGTVYQVSTGTSGGNCSVAGPQNGPRNTAGCNGNNKSSASCDEGCGATSGSGSCTISSAQ